MQNCVSTKGLVQPKTFIVGFLCVWEKMGEGFSSCVPHFVMDYPGLFIL